VSRWLDGEVATIEALADSSAAAIALGEFLTALHRFAPAEISGLAGREDLSVRPLAQRDRARRAAIAAVDGVFDAAAMTRLWDGALSAPGWGRPPLWVHGDFHTGNLLTVGGRLSAVIDFGGLGIGDPACDLTVAFTLMSAKSRDAFRATLDVGDSTWTRGRGWALAPASMPTQATPPSTHESPRRPPGRSTRHFSAYTRMPSAMIVAGRAYAQRHASHLGAGNQGAHQRRSHPLAPSGVGHHHAVA
jgi:aminoglycoside phosphotransferase (APT) family kinase protein